MNLSLFLQRRKAAGRMRPDRGMPRGADISAAAEAPATGSQDQGRHPVQLLRVPGTV